MTVEHRHPRLCLERTIQNAVKVSALHRDVAVQISVTVVRQNDFAQNPRITVETAPPPPKRQASLLLQPPAMESAQQMVRKLTVQHFAKNNSMPQRALQILRMCLSR